MVEQAHQAHLSAFAGRPVLALLRLQVRHHHECEGVGIGFQLGPTGVQVQQLAGRKAEVQRAAPALARVGARTEARGGIGQDGEADDVGAVFVVEKRMAFRPVDRGMDPRGYSVRVGVSSSRPCSLRPASARSARCPGLRS
ncbi:hypothetical protein THIOKS1970002 [Thiocapsa sp. KS1]|nr:hypothetical protein THIOKS1970002 [Thiocapsa sp. KS1]